MKKLIQVMQEKKENDLITFMQFGLNVLFLQQLKCTGIYGGTLLIPFAEVLL